MHEVNTNTKEKSLVACAAAFFGVKSQFRESLIKIGKNVTIYLPYVVYSMPQLGKCKL